MGRPSAITAAVSAVIESQRAPGLTVSALHARVKAAGVTIARGTLDAYLRRGAPAALPTVGAPPVAALAAQASAAVEGGALSELYRARDDVAAARARWAPKLGKDARAVRAYASLARLQAEVARAIVECTPRAPEERYAALEGSALAELLARARVAGETDELGNLRDEVARLRTMNRALLS